MTAKSRFNHIWIKWIFLIENTSNLLSSGIKQSVFGIDCSPFWFEHFECTFVYAGTWFVNKNPSETHWCGGNITNEMGSTSKWITDEVKLIGARIWSSYVNLPLKYKHNHRCASDSVPCINGKCWISLVQRMSVWVKRIITKIIGSKCTVSIFHYIFFFCQLKYLFQHDHRIVLQSAFSTACFHPLFSRHHQLFI